MRGQGRSHLARGTEAASVLPEHRVRVADLPARHVDLAGCAAAVSRVFRGDPCQADCDDEVQATLIAAWLSGRGLPVASAAAYRELRKFTVRRIFSDLRGGRRGAAAIARARARAENAWVRVPSPGDAATTGGPERRVDVTDMLPAVYGSQAQQEARCDARVVARAVVATQPTASRQGPVLALVAGAMDSVEAAAEMGVSGARARQIREDVVRRVRDTLQAWAAGSYDFP